MRKPSRITRNHRGFYYFANHLFTNCSKRLKRSLKKLFQTSKKVPEKTAPNAKNTLEKTAYYVNRLFYHTWKKENSIHAYEIDFLVASRAKIVPIEIKSSDVNTHKSITEFSKKYSGKVLKQFLFSQKDVRHMEQLMFKPIYMLPFAMEDLLE